MPGDETTGPTRPRLNPFAFPSDLDLRFALVVVLVLSASVFLYDGLWMAWPGHSSWFADTAQKCRAIPNAALPTVDALLSFDPNDERYLQTAAYSQAMNECLLPLHQAIALWIVAGLIILLLMALAIYWAFPIWTIRRYHLVRLEAEDGPELSAELTDLCREAGLTRLPTFLTEPLSPGVSGLAFGSLGRYYVSLAGGLVVTFYTDVAVFRAIVRHELAHLRNRDVDKTYFVVAIWWAFLVAAVVPFASTLLSGSLPWAASLAWRGAVLALIVYLTRNAVLRAREVYADLRASVWDGPTGALRRVVEALPSPAPRTRDSVWGAIRGSVWESSWGSTWSSLWQLHPQPSERRRAIDETEDLFRAKPWDAVVAGLAIAITYAGLNILVAQLLGGASGVEAPWWITALAVAPLGVGVVGVGVWRQTFASLARNQPAVAAGRLGLGLGLGAVLGSIVALPAAVDNSFAGNESALPLDLWILRGLWDLGLILGLVVLVRWLAAGAAAWLGALDGSRDSWRAMVAGLVLGGYLLTWWYGLAMGTEDVANALLAEVRGFSGMLLVAVTLITDWVWVLAQSPLTLLAATIFWGYPLVADLWRSGKVTPDRGWAYLETAPDSPSWRGAVPHVGNALAIGLRGGLVYTGLVLLLRVASRFVLPEAVRNQDGVKLATFAAQVGLAVLVAAIVAGIAAGRFHPLGLLHGLAAASAAAALSAVAILAVNLALGGSIDITFAWNTFSSVVNESVFVALPVALVSARRASRRQARLEPAKLEGRAAHAA